MSGALSWLLQPDPELNYSLIAACFALFSAASAAQLAAERADALGGALAGWWLIPAPAAPALAWVLCMRARQRSAAGAAKAKTA